MNAYYLCGTCNTRVVLMGLAVPVAIPAMCPKCVSDSGCHYTLMECFGFGPEGERCMQKEADKVKAKEPRLTSELVVWERLFQ